MMSPRQARVFFHKQQISGRFWGISLGLLVIFSLNLLHIDQISKQVALVYSGAGASGTKTAVQATTTTTIATTTTTAAPAISRKQPFDFLGIMLK